MTHRFCYYDTETCGLTGPAVLIQYAFDDGPIELHNVWTRPIIDTLSLIEEMMKCTVVGFNLAFDHFQLCKLYTIFSLCPDYNVYPEDIIEEIALLEPKGRDGPCLKPYSAMDIMCHARKGPYQSTMQRGDITIRRVPTALAWQLAEELEKRIKLSPIYFAKRKDKLSKQWRVDDIIDDDDEVDPDFKNISLRFNPSSALKALATDAFKLPVDSVLLFQDIEINKAFYPVELGYAPFALAIGKPGAWNGAWPEVIEKHISHWEYHNLARKYAVDDVKYTRDLYKFFDFPEPGDDDSILSCMVGAVRWKGFNVDAAKLLKLREETIASKSKIIEKYGKKIEFNIPTTPAKARLYIEEFMSDTEKLIIAGSTKKVLLLEIAKWQTECPVCKNDIKEDCHACHGKGLVPHPAAERAQEVLNARQCNYEVDFYDKLILAGRFHASFAVIGTLSSRMSGGDGLNAQGIKKTKEVRGSFPLAFSDAILCGGDFAGFEVTLAEACYNDPDLRKDLLSGKKIHALFGVHVYPDMTYEEILATSGTKDDRYTRCKSAVFAMFYGGEGFTLRDRLGVDIETANKAYDAFCRRYKQVGIARKKVFDAFCSMRQPGGIGSKVEWHTPSDYIESMFGFRRYFTLENMICKALFEIANKPPPEWNKVKLRVVRRERVQTASGAVQSALFGAAFGLQASNMRAAANHVIQSSGAQVTKLVQRKVWDVQPIGIKEWIVQPMNIHDEIMTSVKPGYEQKVKEVVNQAVESLRPKVPLIEMEWNIGLKSWADK